MKVAHSELHTSPESFRGRVVDGWAETEAEAWSRAGADPVVQRRPPGHKALYVQLHPS